MGERRDADRVMNRRTALKAGGAGVVAFSFAGCTSRATTGLPSLNPASPDEIRQGGVLTIGIPDPPVGTNPLAVTAEESFAITELLYASGTRVDPIDFGVHPSVYSKWTEQTAGAPGAQPEVQFNVREGLTFTDGTACTVEDVLFTYRYLLEHRPEKYAAILKPITSIERAPGRWDLNMKLSEPVSTYDSEQLGIPILPKHVWQGVEDPESYRPTDHGGPVSLGPGELTSYEPDTEIEVTFREDYPLSELGWVRKKNELLDGGPFLGKIRYQVYDDHAALERAFRRGDVDAMYGSFTADEIEPVLGGTRNTVVGSDEAYTSFGFNLRTTPLGDLPFRQAFGFAFDDHYWIQELHDGHAIEGDFVAPPGYTAVRPEYQPSVIPRPNRPASQPFLVGPSTQAFAFREAGDRTGRVNVRGIRSFLKEGTPITGTGGTFVGKHYPGSLTGVNASQLMAKYEYTFGPVESAVLDDAATDKEIRVDGNTITAINDGPLVMLSHPASEKPKEAAMTRQYAKNLRRIGIPIERQELTTAALLERVYRREEFDITPIDAEPMSEFVVHSLYERFHSDNADDHENTEIGNRKNTNVFLRNAMGYGLIDTATADEHIAAALEEMAVEARNDLIRRAVERIYLDFPVMVASYEKRYWPANRQRFDGFVEDIPAPGSAFLPTQLIQLYRS